MAAVWHRLRGALRARGAAAWPLPVRAVLLDRDGTLVVDVPYNGDPSRVEPVGGATRSLDRLRAAGVRLGVVTNQSGIGRGLVTRAQADAVNAAVDAALGPFATWQVCPHAPEAGCGESPASNWRNGPRGPAAACSTPQPKWKYQPCSCSHPAATRSATKG